MNINDLVKESPFCIQLAMSAWQKPRTSHIIIDPVLAQEFALILYEEIKKPNLGNAKTSELLDELNARLRQDSTLMNYKTTNYK